jgi:hypothetical protein
MANNVILKTLLKSVMPTVTKFVESGKIDTLLQELKARYAVNANMAEGESVEILITTEADGNEYANIVVFDTNLTVKTLLAQQRLSELVTALFNQADL